MNQHELQKITPSNNSLEQYKGQKTLIGTWIQSEDERQVALTYGEKRIGQYDKEDMIGLVEVMAQWRILLGVTTEATEQELIIICQFLYDNFKKFTLSDIKLAMNWTISGKVDVGFVTQKNISSYYISRALNAYEEEKKRIYNKLMYERDKELEKQKQLEQSKVTPQDKANIFKEAILTMYKSYKEGRPVIDFGDFVYNWLKRTKQLSRDAKIVSDAIKYGQDMYLEERKKGGGLNPFANISTDNKEDRQKKLSRQYMIMHYFDSHTMPQIIAKINIQDFTDKND